MPNAHPATRITATVQSILIRVLYSAFTVQSGCHYALRSFCIVIGPGGRKELPTCGNTCTPWVWKAPAHILRGRKLLYTGEREEERRPLAQFAFGPDAAARVFDDSLANRQADARPLVILSMQAGENAEYPV